MIHLFKDPLIQGSTYSGIHLFRDPLIQGSTYSVIHLFRDPLIQGSTYSGIHLFRDPLIQGSTYSGIHCSCKKKTSTVFLDKIVVLDSFQAFFLLLLFFQNNNPQEKFHYWQRHQRGFWWALLIKSTQNCYLFLTFSPPVSVFRVSFLGAIFCPNPPHFLHLPILHPPSSELIFPTFPSSTWWISKASTQ